MPIRIELDSIDQLMVLARALRGADFTPAKLPSMGTPAQGTTIEPIPFCPACGRNRLADVPGTPCPGRVDVIGKFTVEQKCGAEWPGSPTSEPRKLVFEGNLDDFDGQVIRESKQRWNCWTREFRVFDHGRVLGVTIDPGLFYELDKLQLGVNKSKRVCVTVEVLP